MIGTVRYSQEEQKDYNRMIHTQYQPSGSNVGATIMRHDMWNTEALCLLIRTAEVAWTAEN